MAPSASTSLVASSIRSCRGIPHRTFAYQNQSFLSVPDSSYIGLLEKELAKMMVLVVSGKAPKYKHVEYRYCFSVLGIVIRVWGLCVIFGYLDTVWAESKTARQD